MIAKITRGSTAGGLAAYLHGPGRANEHAYDGRLGGAVIGGTLGADGARDGRGWATDMQSAIDARPEIKGPVWHMSLRCAPGDPTLSDAQWRDAAQTMGERMGWAAQPWVMVRHGADHVHIVVSRVGWDRSLWHARNDRRMAQEARQVVERDLGLTRAPVRRETSRSLTSGEHSRALRTGAEPPRHDLARRVRACAEASRGLGREAFERALLTQGVDFRANVASTGRVSGYSFALLDHTDAQGAPVWWKASQLDRSLSWKTLRETLGAPLPPPPVDVPAKGLFERRGAYTLRVEAAQREAVAADLATRRGRVSHVARALIKEREKGSALPWRMRAQTSERTRIVKKRDALGRRVKAGEPLARVGGPSPVGPDAEAMEAVRIASQGFPRSAREAVTRGASGAANLGARAVSDRLREQAEGRRKGRGLGR